MGRLKLFFVICAISFCFCEIDINKKAKLVNGFVEFYNRLPNEIYTCDEGFLQSAQQTEISNAYDIEASLKVSETHNPETVKYLKCTATVVDLVEGVAVMKHHCEEDLNPAGNPTNNEEEVTNVNFVTEADFVRRPVQLDNEVQTDTAVTSGEQFIAIPREEPKVHCIGCSSHVNPHAQGVNELADVGVRQLNSLEPEVQHMLISVVDVERQVQVVNGVRYILTLLIDYNTCLHQQTDTCSISKVCKVTILEKPWLQLSDGAKYRAILANNCTKEWRFGDDGVVPPNDNKNNDTYSNNTDGSDIIKVVHNLEVQSHQQTEKTISDQEIKNIEEQIIPFNQLNIDRATASETTTPLTAEKSKQHVESSLKEQSESQFSLNSVPISKNKKEENLDADKKKTIDDLLNYFNFVGFDPNQNVDQTRTRTKRSFENDLNTIDIAEKYQKLKTNIENAKHIYTLAQSVVDYLNEMDLEVKNRILKHVITAEMESENANNFFYIQFRTILPCKSRACKGNNAVTKICNAVVENSERSPHILNVFCHDEHTKAHVNQMNSISSDDPVLLNLIQETILKIETESGTSRALKLNKIIDANIHRSTYILTKISMLLDQTDCDKNVPYKLRVNCTVVEEYGSDICDVTIHERRLLQERSITYSCTERPIDVRFSINYKGAKSATSSDPVVLEMIQESLRSLENQSNKNNKQIIIKVNSVSTQLVAGFLTQIEFVVGVTTCPIDVNIEDSYKCKLLKNEPLKVCTAKVWDRTWVNNERQVEVFCKNPNVQPKTREPTENFKLSRISSSSDEIKVRTKRNLVGGEREQELKTSTKRHLVGGQETKDPNDPEYKQLAQESLQKYLQDTGNPQPHKLVSVKKVTTQVVAGSLTTIDFEISPEGQTRGDVISCHSKVWQKPWEKFKNINVSCQIDNVKRRTKREYYVGGPVPQNPNDPEYKQLAQESLQKYLQDTGNSQPHKLVSVKKVTTQVVAGSLTIIDFEISPEGQTRGDVISCQSKVWEKKWQKFKNINVSCQIDNVKTRTKRRSVGGQETVDINNPENLKGEGNIDLHFHKINADKRAKRHVITGGLVEQNPNKLKYRELAKISLQKFLQSSSCSQPHKVINVDKAFTQVVSGLRTVISFKVAPVSVTPSNEIKCLSEIWQKPWENTMKIVVNCNLDDCAIIDNSDVNNGNRSKRNVYVKNKWVGGPQEEDPSNEEYKELAREALQKYQKKHKATKNHIVVKVKKVTMQVVSGTIYNIDFTIAHTSCAEDVSECDVENPVLNCHSQTKLRPWLLVNDITVWCSNSKKREKRKANLKNTEESSNMLQFTEVEITDLDERGKRQAGIDDDNLDDETRFYYADRAIEQLNQQQRPNNLHKLITVHAIQSSMHMDNTPMVRVYFEAAETYCLRGNADTKLVDCEELDADNHKLCLARIWPSPDDDMVVQQVNVVCDDDEKFESVSGLSIASYLRASLKSIEQSSEQKHKLVHLGEPQLIPSLDSNTPMKLNFIIGITNCSKDVDNVNKYNCYMDTTIPARSCSSYIWLTPNSRAISKLSANCAQTEVRSKRSVSLDPTNATADDLEIQKMVHESLAKLEMTSAERYKLKVLKINGYKSKVTSGKVTTIDFDVAFTSCLKFEWIDDIGTCEVLEHLPRRHCIAEIWERLWLNNGRNIEVSCQDEEAPIEAHVEFQSASTATALADRALKHIEAKYPHPRKQKVIRIYSMDKQVVAGVHYRMKMEVGLTNCSALSAVNNCVLDKKSGQSKFCRVNVWLRPWTDHPPNFRVSCDYQEGAMAELFHQIQAEHLFRDFLTTYDREYVNDHEEVLKRFQIFKTNIQRIHELNTHERGTATYGVTRFADLSYEEFTQKHMGLKPSLRNENQVPMARAQIPDVAIPDQFDWREHGAVTEVKNQGSCGSCWAFSVTGNIEGQWQLKTGKLVSLSEQELVDCDKMDDGCNGGLPDNAYRAIEQLGGLELENDYPYEGEDDKCVFNKTMAKVQITSAVNITSNETDMAKWLVEKGPISIGINANAMQFYMGGVSHPWKMLCNPKNLDHGVLIVGYGVKDYPLFHKQLPYWTVKNSWGPSWGEQGYYRVFRGDGTCGLNLMASSAVV